MNISASIFKLTSATVAVYKRFPLLLVFSTIVFCLCLSLIYEWEWEVLSTQRTVAIIWGGVIAIPLYFTFQIVSELKLGKWLFWGSLALLIVIPINSTYMLWEKLNDTSVVFIQLATFIFVHGLISTIAYFKFKAEKGFWQFNSLLLLNFINSSFYIAVISTGILAAFGLIDVLFKEFYGDECSTVLAFVSCFLHPLLFFAWLPDKNNWQTKIDSFDLPKFFRTLIVFILIPLSIAYLIILYVYIGQALILGELPKGTIEWTVLCFTVASVYALVLVYPYRKNEDQKLVFWFSKILPFALSPLVVLLWVAVLMRVGEYGFTPSRVLLTLLAIWLTVINLYLYSNKKWGLMPLAGVLTALCLVAIGWPINVKSLSIWSQQSIQREVLEANNIAEGDSVTQVRLGKLDSLDREKLEGTDMFLGVLDKSLISLESNQSLEKKPNSEDVDSWRTYYINSSTVTDIGFLLNCPSTHIYQMDISLYDGAIEDTAGGNLGYVKLFINDRPSLQIESESEIGLISLDKLVTLATEIDGDPTIEQSTSRRVEIPTLTGEFKGYKVILLTKSFSVELNNVNNKVGNVTLFGYIYFLK